MKEGVIGILGGMGPEATAELFFRIIRATPAKKDQDHLRIIIDNNPKIPDRTAAILHGGPSPLPMMIETAKNLERAGASFLIIPCNTSHYYIDELQKEIEIPVINMIEVTASRLKRKNFKKVGLLATNGTIKTGLYQNALGKEGIEAIVPQEDLQKEVMRAIYDHIKAGDLDAGRKIVLRIANELIKRGAEAVICGCTEISLVLKEGDISVPVIDPLQILAEEAVKLAFETGNPGKNVLSSMVRRIRESATMKTLEEAKEVEKKGIKVIYLSVGEPDFGTPENVIKAAFDAMKSGFTHYTSSKGILELREAISEKFKEDNGLDYDLENIIVTPGTKFAVFEAILALVEGGDEVIVPAPYWVSYEEIVKAAGGKLKAVPTKEDFSLDVEGIASSIGPRTKVLILNTPNNPTGAVYDEKSLGELAEILSEREVYVISDEIYEKLIYEGKHISIASMDGMEDLTIVVNGFSKAYAMTGWRLGYAAGPKEIISAMNKIQQHSISCAPAFIQKAAVTALKATTEFVKDMVEEFRRRRDFIVERISKIPSFNLVKPKGAFYVFPDISGTGMSSSKAAEAMLYKAGVLVTPGKAFGGYDDHIRISFANSMENIKEAMDRLEKLFG